MLEFKKLCGRIFIIHCPINRHKTVSLVEDGTLKLHSGLRTPLHVKLYFMKVGLFDNLLAGRVSGIVTSGHEVVRFDSAVDNIQESLVIEEYNRFAFEPGSFR